MIFAHVTNGTVDQTGNIPPVWQLDAGGSVSSFDQLPALWTSEGWLPLVEVRPTFNAATQQLGDPTYTVAVDTVTATYPIIARPAVDINADLIRTKAAAAIAANTTYLAGLPALLTSITNARATIATGLTRATTGQTATVTTLAQAQSEVRAAWTVLAGVCSMLDGTMVGLSNLTSQTSVLGQEATALIRLALSQLDSTAGT